MNTDSGLANDPPSGTTVTVKVSPGELIDKIAILGIKTERITDPEKLANIRIELETLTAVRDAALIPSALLRGLAAELKRINATLWDVEDDIRDHERDGDFGPGFIELARNVYRTNDRRSEVKRRINELLGSRLIEEKSYAKY